MATACPASLTSLRCRRAAFWPLGREVDRGTWIRAAPPTSAFCLWALQVAPQPPDGPLRARRSARRLPRASVRRPPSFSPSPRREPSRSPLIPPNQAFNSLNSVLRAWRCRSACCHHISALICASALRCVALQLVRSRASLGAGCVTLPYCCHYVTFTSTSSLACLRVPAGDPAAAGGIRKLSYIYYTGTPGARAVAYSFVQITSSLAVTFFVHV